MDEIFIRMCREAKEIQEQKELIMDSGDLVINKSNYPDPSFVFCVNETVELESDKFDWIPRQEDLQEIIKNEKQSDNELLNLKFMNWLKFKNWWKYNLTLLWLCFVMETC